MKAWYELATSSSISSSGCRVTKIRARLKLCAYDSAMRRTSSVSSSKTGKRTQALVKYAAAVDIAHLSVDNVVVKKELAADSASSLICRRRTWFARMAANASSSSPHPGRSSAAPCASACFCRRRSKRKSGQAARASAGQSVSSCQLESKRPPAFQTWTESASPGWLSRSKRSNEIRPGTQSGLSPRSRTRSCSRKSILRVNEIEALSNSGAKVLVPP
mmetsp:Transcript_11157/g.26813  ORF Transcript_11157/g.26813 Transcript_11157/m.26813 type:complete len:218 (-) Transcript_11157:222-875(-)